MAESYLVSCSQRSVETVPDQTNRPRLPQTSVLQGVPDLTKLVPDPPHVVPDKTNTCV